MGQGVQQNPEYDWMLKAEHGRSLAQHHLAHVFSGKARQRPGKGFDVACHYLVQRRPEKECATKTGAT
jgi:hypothetical protein